MADETEQPAAIPHFEDVNAPVVYADACFGGGLMGGDNITLTFVTKILDHTQRPPASNTKTTLRLVLPREAAVNLAAFITDFLSPKGAGQSPPPAANVTLN